MADHDVISPDEVSDAASTAEQRRLSVVLQDLARDAAAPVSVEQIRHALGDRSLAALLAFFAAINLLPLPPGTTIVLGPPLMIIAAQMVAGQQEAWLPRLILGKSIDADRFRQMMARLMPRLLWLERVIRPRWWPFPSEAVADRVLGVIALILGTAVTLPIPLGNWLPAFSIFLISLALSERDGLLLVAGLLVAVAAFVVIGLVFGTAHALFGMVFG